MSNEDHISAHYTHGNLLKALEVVLCELGESCDESILKQLSSVEEFHIGGSEATEHLLKQTEFFSEALWLDIGCGLGGTARYLARQLDSQVIGIDLTAEYLSVGNMFNQKLGLASQISLIQASAINLPFSDNAFDGTTMLHVGMNIVDKQKLFTEVYRCLRKGSSFLLYDVMQVDQDDITYPLPWSSTAEHSYVSSVDTYKKLLIEAGFDLVKINNRSEFSINYFNEQASAIKALKTRPGLSLQTLISDNAKIKFTNLINQIKSNALEPVEIIAMKRG